MQWMSGMATDHHIGCWYRAGKTNVLNSQDVTPTVTAVDLMVVPLTVRLAMIVRIYGGFTAGFNVPMVKSSPPLAFGEPVIPVSVVPLMEKVQVTELLMSLPPWSLAVRVNPRLVVVLWVDGVTVIEVTFEGTTVSVVLPAIVGFLVEVAVIVAVPTA